MAHIKEVTFTSVGKNEGCLCDRCGTYISNIVTVHYVEGMTINYGQDCFEKLCKESKLNDYGMKIMKKGLTKLAKYTKEYEMWKTITYEQAREKGLTAQIDPDSNINTWSTAESDKSAWCGKPFEEYREWVLNEVYPRKFKDCEKEIKRFEKVNFKEG